MSSTHTDLAAYRQRAAQAVQSIPADKVERAVRRLQACRAANQMVWVLGNGGSQANAQHLVLHLRQAGIAAIDLLADNAFISAEANDLGWHGIPVRGFSHYPKPGAIIVISGSGNSLNVVDLLRNFADVPTIGLLGMGGGRALAMCDVAIVVDSAEYGPVEDAQAAVVHMLAAGLQAPVHGPSAS